MQRLKEKLNEKIILEHKNPNHFNEDSNIVLEEQEEDQRESKVIMIRNQTQDIVPDFAITLSEAKQRIATLQNFVNEMMIPDLDYGIIPGCKKPSLYKAGAEKLCDIFGFSKHIDVLNRVEDWENKIFHYEVKATLINKRTGQIEAEGIGSCNNREKKYSASDAFTLINTVLKMAKKRAIIDAVLSATRASGIFSQDLEDIKKDFGNDEEKILKKDEPRTSKASDSVKIQSRSVTQSQLSLIMKLVSQNGITIPQIRSIMQARYGINESKELNTSQASDLIKFLSQTSSSSAAKRMVDTNA